MVHSKSSYYIVRGHQEAVYIVHVLDSLAVKDLCFEGEVLLYLDGDSTRGGSDEDTPSHSTVVTRAHSVCVVWGSVCVCVCGGGVGCVSVCVWWGCEFI